LRLCNRNIAVSGTRSNISLTPDWNLIGYSSDVNLSLANVKFHNGSDEFTWANALANNKMQAYLAYYDSSSATASQRKYKYVATSDLNMDDTMLREGKGYWLYSNEAGNLTLPGVGGSYSNETYAWSKLRFVNGSGSEKSISEAFSDNWIFMTGDSYIYYWDETGEDFYTVSDHPAADDDTLYPWGGYFIYSNVDNLTLIRQN